MSLLKNQIHNHTFNICCSSFCVKHLENPMWDCNKNCDKYNKVFKLNLDDKKAIIKNTITKDTP